MDIIEHGSEEQRLEALREILVKLRTGELTRIREYRKDQAQERLSVPSDDLDVARSLADVEMHASLIERSEERLKSIDTAFSRLERGLYGFCDQCGSEIPIERLRALPFAIFCVDCQQKRETRRTVGSLGEPFAHRWVGPQETEESFDAQDPLTEAEDDLLVSNSSFGPEEDEIEQAQQAEPRRGRRRKRA